MQKSIHIVSLILLFASCENDKQDIPMHYNEDMLRKFVMSAKTMDEKMAVDSLNHIITIASADSTVLRETTGFFEKQFGNPNSPHRNENLYAALLQSKIQSGWYDSLTNIKTRSELFLLKQNRPGSNANDFMYITPAGYRKWMYAIHSPYLLLFFYNPECNACKEMKDAISLSPVISSKMKSGELKLLAIYTDRDEQVWLNHLKEMPDSWMHGRDEDEYLYKNKIYNLRAIPSVYLLDKDKKVLLKDCVEVGEIEGRIW